MWDNQGYPSNGRAALLTPPARHQEVTLMRPEDTSVRLCECGCGQPTKIAKLTDRRRGTVKGQPNRFLKGHHIAVYNRVAKKLPGPGYLVQDCGYTTPCWVWQRFINPGGYGMLKIDGRTKVAHRDSYERLVGPIPEGLELDHLCRVRACVNPDHLEPVTGRVNILRGEGQGAKHARKTHCVHGHPLSGDNIWVSPQGWRRCLTCKRRWS